MQQCLSVFGAEESIGFSSTVPVCIKPGAKTINVFRACLGAQLTICAQK